MKGMQQIPTGQVISFFISGTGLSGSRYGSWISGQFYSCSFKHVFLHTWNENTQFFILERNRKTAGHPAIPDMYCIQLHGISSILLQISWISPDRLWIAQKKTSALHIGRKNWNSVTGGSWNTLFDRQAVCFRRAKEAGGQIKWAVP